VTSEAIGLKLYPSSELVRGSGRWADGTDRPALASQDEISSQEGRTDAVRPSCVVRRKLQLSHTSARCHQQNSFRRAEQGAGWAHFSFAY
jgi:hypothetical protein